MALPENGKKISAWNAGIVDQNSYFLQAKGGATEKVSVDEIADYVGTSATFSGLNTTSKTPVGAINEINAKDASDIPYDNTASGMTATNVQAAINEVAGKELSATLTAGSTSLAFTDSAITADSLISVFTDGGLLYNSITTAVGSVVLTFDEQATDVAVVLIVR